MKGVGAEPTITLVHDMSIWHAAAAAGFDGARREEQRRRNEKKRGGCSGLRTHQRTAAFETTHLPPDALATLFVALLRMLEWAYLIICRIVPDTENIRLVCGTLTTHTV